MIQISKIKLIIFLISINLLGQNLSLRIQSEIPTIFRTGMKDVLSQNYKIIDNNIDINECDTNECLSKLSQELNASSIISIKVYPVDESKLKFKAKFIDFKNEKIISKTRYFIIDDERALFNFGKTFAKIILTDEKLKVKKIIKIDDEKVIRVKDDEIKEYNKKVKERKQEENNSDIDSYHYSTRKPKVALRDKYDFGITGGIGGSNGIGVSLDWFLTENLNIEISTVGYIPAVLGIKLFFTPKENLSPYVALHVAPIAVYIPIGFQYISETGFTFSGEVGVMGVFIFNTEIVPWGGIKIGYHY